MLSTGCFESFCRHPEKRRCIKDVACVVGEVNGYRAGFGQDFPEVLGWLNAWTMSDGELGSLMLTIERAGNAEAGARQWLAENRSLADGWLAAKGTASP